MNCEADLKNALVHSLDEAKDRYSLWKTILNTLEAETVLEVGVWKGEFSASILMRCPSIKRYFMLDPWRPLQQWNKPLNVESSVFDDALSAALAATRFAREKVVILRGTTIESIHDIADRSLDFAYIDGDHTLRGITHDLINVFPKLKDGGILGGDDFVPSIWQHASRYEPTFVFPFAVYFAEAHSLPIYALPHNQFLIHKTSEAGYEFTDFMGTYRSHEIRSQLGLVQMIGRRARELMARRSTRK